MKLIVMIIGMIGLMGVAVLGLFLAVAAPVKAPGVNEFFIVGVYGLPFLFYVLFTMKNWSKRLGLMLGIPLHLIWVPEIGMFFSKGNFEIPLFLIAAFIVYVIHLWFMPSDVSKTIRT